MTPTSSEDLWEQHAAWWQRAFTEGADPEYEEQILPLVLDWTRGFGRVLEVGTGEGQVARAIAEVHGSAVVGVDPTSNQIFEAARRGGRVRGYVQAPACALPFGSEAFDAAVICLVLEHVEDLDGALDEVERVLRPKGRLLVLLNHPLLQTPGSGWIDDHVIDPPEQYWRIGPYLREAAVIEEVERSVHIRFIHRPLHRYVNALASRGFRIEQMIEPAPPEGFLALAPEYQDAADVPRLLALAMRKDPTVPVG